MTHVDGSGRLQSVSKKTNPLYWNLIEAFRQKTDVPIVLNTSLNENEPIVRTPTEAISCFLRTAMDQIVLGNYVIDREHPSFPTSVSQASVEILGKGFIRSDSLAIFALQSPKLFLLDS